MTAIKGFVHRHRLSVMYVPVLLLFAVFVFAPLISGLNIALTNWNGYSQHYQYVGFDNFRQLATDERIHRSFINTMFYGVGSTIIQNIWGLLYALLLNQLFFGRSAVRAFVYLPVIMSGLVMGYIWYFILQYSGGALNDLMLLLGMERVDWLANGTRNVGIITYVTSMQFVGQAMIIYLAGLQLIQKSYYEGRRKCVEKVCAHYTAAAAAGNADDGHIEADRRAAAVRQGYRVDRRRAGL